MINKDRGANKFIVYATNQTITNLAGADSLSKNIYLHNFHNTISGFKVNARRQGSTYKLDMTNSPPVFYQLDKWHEYMHPAYWSKDFDFEAEVDDSGNNLDLVTELPSGAAPGDYTDYTTAVKLTPSSNNVKYIFTPRDVTANNNYQVWLRMKSVAQNKGRVELKLDGSNLYTVDSITGGWKWYAYQTCGCFPMTFYNMTATNHMLTITSADSILIDRIYLGKDQNLNWQTPVFCAESSCTFNYRTANNAANDSIPAKKRTVDYKIDVRPNPMSASCTIYSEAITADREYSLRVINALGVEVKSMRIVNTARAIELQTSELPNGFYSLILTDNRSSFKTTKKIVVQHP